MSSKREVFEYLWATEDTFIVSLKTQNALLPEYLYAQEWISLLAGRSCRVPVRDAGVTDLIWYAVLRFGGLDFRVEVPWTSVFAIGDRYYWPMDAPIQRLTAYAGGRQRTRPRRGHLRRVK